MKNSIIKSILLLLSVVCILSFKLPAIYGDTDGTEMQVLQPEHLEIQLGTNWAGVEFQFKTDAGVYPGIITVGEDGILRLEIGGSSSYILSCIGSSVTVPSPDTEAAQAPATNEEVISADETNTSDEPEEPFNGATGEPRSALNKDAPKSLTNAGIPVLHITLFVGGLLLAVGVLVILHITGKKRTSDGEYDEE